MSTGQPNPWLGPVRACAQYVVTEVEHEKGAFTRLALCIQISVRYCICRLDKVEIILGGPGLPLGWLKQHVIIDMCRGLAVRRCLRDGRWGACDSLTPRKRM